LLEQETWPEPCAYKKKKLRTELCQGTEQQIWPVALDPDRGMKNKPRRTPVTSQTNEMENWKNRRAKNTKQKNMVFRIGGGKKNESLGTGRNNLWQ
jgi:hypothetical protein